MLFKQVDNFSLKENIILFKDTYFFAKEVFLEMIFGIDFVSLSSILAEEDNIKF
jgi:hypothetical protein